MDDGRQTVQQQLVNTSRPASDFGLPEWDRSCRLSELLTGRENTICVSSLNVRKAGKAPNDKVTWVLWDCDVSRDIYRQYKDSRHCSNDAFVTCFFVLTWFQGWKQSGVKETMWSFSPSRLHPAFPWPQRWGMRTRRNKWGANDCRKEEEDEMEKKGWGNQETRQDEEERDTFDIRLGPEPQSRYEPLSLSADGQH